MKNTRTLPARPKAQPIGEKPKKRRRARRPELLKDDASRGFSAAQAYRNAVGYFQKFEREAEDFAADGKSKALKRKRAALGFRIRKPWRGDDDARLDQTRAARRRREIAVLAQAARRAGRMRTTGALFRRDRPSIDE